MTSKSLFQSTIREANCEFKRSEDCTINYQQLAISRRGFSRFELFATTALVFVLAAAVFWAFDPIERARQQRDAQRLADLETLYEAIEKTSAVLGSTHGVPVSSASVDVTYASDGTGWIPVNVSDQIGELPADPLNGKSFIDVWGNSVFGEYQFISDGYLYVLRTHLEAEKNLERYSTDGNDNGWFELGTAPGLSTFFGL